MTWGFGPRVTSSYALKPYGCLGPVIAPPGGGAAGLAAAGGAGLTLNSSTSNFSSEFGGIGGGEFVP